VRLHDTAIARVRVQSSFWTFLGVIPSVTLIVVLALGALAVAQDKVTLGTLVAFTTLMMSLVWPVTSLGFLLSMTQDAMTAADRIAEIFDAENTIRDGDSDLPVVRGELAFEHVSFRFPDSEHDVLHDLNLRLLPGETVALVGATGSGKTILTTLVARLWDVTGGRITLDGVDVRDLKLDRLRQVVATAFEDPVLFSMSARENIALGRPDATDADIDEAVQVAQAQFVHELPFGLDTRIGEQGMSLSGGQRQRLALARAVLAAPAVLVLDDTLSALDIHTEALVEEALQRVLIADKVALLENGTITHVGTHSELLATVPSYRELLSADGELDEVELTDAEIEDADELLEVAS
jgi:ATP-binding cassette subfamily B protein